MKKSIILQITLFSLISSANLHPAQLGKFLSKRLPSLKADEQSLVYIYFTDKGNTSKYEPIRPSSFISERSIKRRMKVKNAGSLTDERDFPLERSYVRAVSVHAVNVRHELKWFNAVSIVATKSQIGTIQKLPFIKEIELVGRWKRSPGLEPDGSPEKYEPLTAPSGVGTFDYGTSFTQVSQINVPAVHDKGIYGQGVVICVLDNGFRLLTHESFSSMNIIAQQDFVDHKESVIPLNPDQGFGSHGVKTLSTIGGFKPGELIGPAFRSDFILARTENDSSETPIEEDNWVKAIEWADSIGADVTSTSLSYLAYDTPYASWTWEDMDGNTTLITRAADIAVELGIIVVVSASNAGYNASHNTLGAPADGDSVITAGAVNSSGDRAAFSSVGPTTDVPARIKPDVMAMGVGVKVASALYPNSYDLGSGTSYSCPLSAGVAALILCANPTLTPAEIRDAMRETATQAGSPDNLMGWGVLNADSAVKYHGVLPAGRISGLIYNDIDGSGSRETGEPAIAGIKVFIAGTTVDSVFSTDGGLFEFDTLAIGSYSISNEISDGWIQTQPAGNYSVNLLHGIDTSGFIFGHFQLGSVQGTAFDDLNHNGIRDAGEPGLPGRVVRLTGAVSLTEVTDSTGHFAFQNLGPGIYTLSESVQVGWIQTVPVNYGSYTITMKSGLDTAGLIFGGYYDSVFHIAAGWNLLSLPYIVTDHAALALYPSAVSGPFIYNRNYVALDTIPERIGFWLKSNTEQNVDIRGIVRLSDTIDVAAGWNIIGALSVPLPTSSIIQIPENNVISEYYKYDTEYRAVSLLIPSSGYWIKVKENGKLILSGVSYLSKP